MAQPQMKEVFRLLLNPGTYRDFSDFTADGCIESVWFRSYHRNMKKIGGYQSIGYLPYYTLDTGFAAPEIPLVNFKQPTFPNIQSTTSGANSQDYSAPFLGNKAQGMESPYQLYTPVGAPDALSNKPDLRFLGGYGVVRKTINIISDGANTVIGAGDAHKDGLDTYPVSGVAFSTNTDKNLIMPAFQPLALPDSLPAVKSLATKMEWLPTNPVLDFSDIIYANGRYLGVANNNIYWSDGGIEWTACTGLPAQLYARPDYIGNYTVGAIDGVYWSADGKAWTKSTGVIVQVNVTWGSFAGTETGIYYTVDNGVTYVASTLVTGSIRCFASSNSAFVVGTASGILYSQDGTTWLATNVTSGTVKKIVYANSRFVAVMSALGNISASILTTVDVLTWSPCKALDSSNITNLATSLIFFNSTFVVTTLTGVFYSTDGTIYENSIMNDDSKITSQYNQVAFRNNVFVAVGTTQAISSLDGLMWYPTSLVGSRAAICGGLVWVASGVYSLSDVSLIQKSALAVTDIFTPDEYIWNIDSVNLTTGEESVAAATYVVVHPSCGVTKSIDDTTDYYVFVRNLKELATSQNVPLRWNEVDVPATTLKNWLVPMIYGQNINPKIEASTSGNFMNSDVKVSGGICAVGPFLFAYGNEGLIRNSDANNPSKWFSLTDEASVYRNSGLANDVNVTTSKIVKGLPVKSAGTSYAALFWSLDSLILATFVGAPAVFNYSIVSSAVTIIAANSAIELYGSFYWIGDNRFYVYSGGQINEVPNNQNRNWFFNNINPQRQHIIWASLNPQYNEIWWFFPLKDSYECNHALIYNYADKVWYDTPINRSAGFYTGVYRHPVWVSNIVNPEYNGYDYYLHEQGVDSVDYLGNVYPIHCSFVTPDIGLVSSPLPASPKQNQGLKQNWVNILRFEPDGLINGTWNFFIRGRTNPRGGNSATNTIYSFDENTLEVDIQEQWRIAFLCFSSSDIGADWYVGNNLLTLTIGDCEGI